MPTSLLVRDVMQPDPRFCAPHDSCTVAAELMLQHHIGYVPVVEAGSSRVRGVVTDRDICMAALREDRPLTQIPVEHAMTGGIKACRFDDPLEEAEQLMRDTHVRRLAVLDDSGGLCGVLSLSDLARASVDEGTVDPTEVSDTLGRIVTATS